MGEVDVKELDGRMVPLSSASEDLEISASNAGPAEMSWTLAARLNNERLSPRQSKTPHSRPSRVG